jgi:hypothetical protein
MKKEQAYKAVTREDLIKDFEKERETLLEFDLPRAQRLADRAKGTDKEERQKRRLDTVARKILNLDNQIADLRKPKKGQMNPKVLLATVVGLAAGLEGVVQ